MIDQATTPPPCPLCGQLMTVRRPAVDGAHLSMEFVCLDIDCLEFGVYYQLTDAPA